MSAPTATVTDTVGSLEADVCQEKIAIYNISS